MAGCVRGGAWSGALRSSLADYCERVPKRVEQSVDVRAGIVSVDRDSNPPRMMHHLHAFTFEVGVQCVRLWMMERDNARHSIRTKRGEWRDSQCLQAAVGRIDKRIGMTSDLTHPNGVEVSQT